MIVLSVFVTGYCVAYLLWRSVPLDTTDGLSFFTPTSINVGTVKKDSVVVVD